jgi:hypothetical protein
MSPPRRLDVKSEPRADAILAFHSGSGVAQGGSVCDLEIQESTLNALHWIRFFAELKISSIF